MRNSEPQKESSPISTRIGPKQGITVLKRGYDKWLTLKVARLLAQGKTLPEVRKRMRIGKSLAHYHQSRARDLGMIAIEHSTKGRRPQLYREGPNLQQWEGRGVVDGEFVPIFIRAHPSEGNHFSVDVIKVGDLEKAGLRDSGDRYSGHLTVPVEVNGSEGEAQLTFHWPGLSRGTLIVSPPERWLSIDQIEEFATPFGRSLDHVLETLERQGWTFETTPRAGLVHYAIVIDWANPLFKALIDGCLRKLEVGDSEEELVFWWDNSHNHPEVETTEIGLALDLLAICNIWVKASKEV